MIRLLRDLVAARSPSREEGPAVDVIEAWLRPRADVTRRDRNLFAVKDSGRPGPTLLLLSHTDTVPATSAWTRPPWTPTEEGGRLYGLGANDAKASVAAMAVAMDQATLRAGRVLFAPVCEEETGRGGLEVLLPHLPAADAAIVGEPTGMQPAVAQNGLLVLDCTVRGRAGHAARPHLADNPIPRLAEDLLRVGTITLDRAHPVAGRTTLVPTMVHAGERHNVIPPEATFTLDLRTTAAYSHAELTEIVRGALQAEVAVRSDRFHPVATPADARILRLVQQAHPDGVPFASPTLSDWAHLGALPAVKWGPGLSEVSHTADEWVELAMVERAVTLYQRVIEAFCGDAA